MGWTEIQAKGKVPCAISHHQSIVIGKAMWLIGGSSSDSLTASNQSIHKLDLSSHMWDVVQALGEVPDTLDEHTAVSDGQHIYTFGGFLGGERSNQVHHLDTKTMEWTHLKTKSDKKTP